MIKWILQKSVEMGFPTMRQMENREPARQECLRDLNTSRERLDHILELIYEDGLLDLYHDFNKITPQSEEERQIQIHTKKGFSFIYGMSHTLGQYSLFADRDSQTYEGRLVDEVTYSPHTETLLTRLSTAARIGAIKKFAEQNHTAYQEEAEAKKDPSEQANSQ